MRTRILLPAGLLVLVSLAQAQMVRGGLWAYESLDGDEFSYPGLTVTREVIEASRLNGVRIDAAGRMTHMCWKPHRLGAGDKATLEALGEGARIDYVNVSETAYEDITTSTHGRWRWISDNCEELVAWEPPAEENERRPERETKADRIAAAPANGQVDTRTASHGAGPGAVSPGCTRAGPLPQGARAPTGGGAGVGSPTPIRRHHRHPASPDGSRCGRPARRAGGAARISRRIRR